MGFTAGEIWLQQVSMKRSAFIVRCFMFWKGEAYALPDFADIKGG